MTTAASSPGLSVPSHARERSGRGGGDGRGEGRGEARKGKACGTQEPPRDRDAGACARWRHFRVVRFGSHRPILKRDPWLHPSLRNATPAGGEQAPESSGSRAQTPSEIGKFLCSSAVPRPVSSTESWGWGEKKKRGDSLFPPRFVANVLTPLPGRARRSTLSHIWGGSPH